MYTESPCICYKRRSINNLLVTVGITCVLVGFGKLGTCGKAIFGKMEFCNMYYGIVCGIPIVKISYNIKMIRPE